MEPNPPPPPKLKRGPAQLKPLITATLQQALRLTRLHNSKSPLPLTPVPPTPAPASPPLQPPFLSLFLTLLPLEIRARIYQFVFAGRELHLLVPWFSKDKPLTAKLRHSEFNSDHAGGKWLAGWRGRVARGYPEHDQYLEFKQEPGVTGKLLALPLCCRQVYVLALGVPLSAL